jgi:hypothetical protein
MIEPVMQAVSVPHVVASDSVLQETLLLLVVAAVLIAVHCVVIAVRDRTPVPLLALLGGVVALPIEPFWDVNVLFTFAANSAPIAFTAFGRSIPLYLAFIYPAFIGWGSALSYRLIRTGHSARELVTLAAGFLIGDAVIEIVGIKLGLWIYYGGQPLTIVGWPILFGVLNGAITLLGGALLAALEGTFHGYRRVLLVLAVPSAYMGTYAVAGWPTWAALNADIAPLARQVAGTVSVTLCVLIMWLAASSVCKQRAVAPVERDIDGATGAGRRVDAGVQRQPGV